MYNFSIGSCGLNTLSKVLTPLFVLGLCFTVTNLVVISAVPAAVMLVLLPPLVACTLMSHFCGAAGSTPSKAAHAIFHNPVFLWVSLCYLIGLMSVLFYHPTSLLNYGFYRYDGNFIISYAAFLFLPFFNYQGDPRILFTRFIYLSLAVNIPVFVYYLANYVDDQYYNYYLLFRSTNAAGSFFVIVLSLAVAHYVAHRKYSMLATICMLSLMLFFTSSRGAMLALAGAITLCYTMQHKYWKWLLLAGFLGIICAQSVLTHHYYPIYRAGVSGAQYHILTNDGKLDVKKRNVQLRLLNTWPKAWDMFIDSPWIGNGFGAFNDHAITTRGEISSETYPVFQFNDQHTHHSFLHILAEQGIVGFIVFSMVWFYQFRYLRDATMLPWIRNGLLIAFWSVILSSFIGNRLTTPAMILPYSLLFLFFHSWIQQHADTKAP